jgi:uncharacterized MnhB-related membrane protein
MIETLIHVLVLAGLVVSALLIFHFRDLLAAVIASALFSFLISLEFYLLQAPDVAIAQAAIGAGITTAIFIMAIRATGRHEEGSA